MGIACEFVIAAAAEVSSAQSSRWNTPQQSVRYQSEQQEVMVDEDGVGWGMDGGMSPARTTMTRDKEDLYGEPMEEDEEVPPTQQERYQGIFD